MGILYALVARGTVVLAEFTGTTTNAAAIARQILEKIPGNNDTHVSYSQDRYIFHVKRTDGLTVLCMADDSVGRRIPFAFLEEIHQRFVRSYGRAVLTAEAYAMNDEFSRVLNQQMEYFSSDPNADRINRLKGEMSQVRNVMIENIDKVLDRGDRLELLVDKAAVDFTGREFNRNRLIALMAAIVLEEHPGTTIVTDSVTSDGLTTFIEKKLGGKHHRFKRGYKNVIDEAIRLNSIGEETHLAIETSGHGALKENNWLDDGAYLMVKILNKLASARASGVGGGSNVLTGLIEGLQEPAFAAELRLKINQNHQDLKGGDMLYLSDLSGSMEKLC